MPSKITTAGQDFLIEAGRVLMKPDVKEGAPVRIRELRSIVEALGHLFEAIGEDYESLERQLAAATRQSGELKAAQQEILDRLRILDA